MHFYSLKVAVLKQKIEEEQGSTFPAAGLKLIYAGKEEDHTLRMYSTSFEVLLYVPP